MNQEDNAMPKLGCVNHDCDKCKQSTGQEPVAGLERCEFDDECNFCKSPQGGSFTRLIHNAEDCTEAEFYICGDCVYEAVTRHTKSKHPKNHQEAAPRKWVGLTKKEVHDMYDADYAVFHQKIEAKLKEKNCI